MVEYVRALIALRELWRSLYEENRFAVDGRRGFTFHQGRRIGVAEYKAMQALLALEP